MFLKEGQETLTVTVVVDKASGSVGATAVNHKGAEKSGVDYITTWLETFGYRQFEIHTDGESSSIEGRCQQARRNVPRGGEGEDRDQAQGVTDRLARQLGQR